MSPRVVESAHENSMNAKRRWACELYSLGAAAAVPAVPTDIMRARVRSSGAERGAPHFAVLCSPVLLNNRNEVLYLGAFSSKLGLVLIFGFSNHHLPCGVEHVGWTPGTFLGTKKLLTAVLPTTIIRGQVL